MEREVTPPSSSVFKPRDVIIHKRKGGGGKNLVLTYARGQWRERRRRDPFGELEPEDGPKGLGRKERT